MALVIPDRTPTSAHAIEARSRALPVAIKDKRARLEARKDTTHAASEALRTRHQEVREERDWAQRQLKRESVGGAPPPERQHEVDRLSEEVARFGALYQVAKATWECAARVYQNCRDWLEA